MDGNSSLRYIQKSERLVLIRLTRNVNTSASQELRASAGFQRRMTKPFLICLKTERLVCVLVNQARQQFLQIFLLLFGLLLIISAVVLGCDIFVDAFQVRSVREAAAINTIAAVSKVDAVNAFRTVLHTGTACAFVGESVGHQEEEMGQKAGYGCLN